jgi:23S rRNA (cytidine1920-2'-O)/16S rRNA (cytidine1409-2'-O)-methyltransferase
VEERLDRVIVARGLASSRERAQGLVEAGLVLVDGQVAEKVSQKVGEEAEIVVTGEALPYVGRGGVKLEAALKMFRINARGARCLDVGASTGGFTDCLLQRGAEHVTAIDVGHGQLAPKLQNDPRIELREGVNARYLSPEQFPEPFDIAAIDVSFISLTLILPAVAPLVRPGGHIIALVKPEFEAGREAVGARGIVRSAEARKKALHKVTAFAKDQLGLEVRGTMPSPLAGGSGNKEYIACLRRPAELPAANDVLASADEPTELQ